MRLHRRFQELRQEIKSTRPQKKRLFVLVVLFFLLYPVLLAEQETYSLAIIPPLQCNEYMYNPYAPFLTNKGVHFTSGKVEPGETFYSILSHQGFSSLEIAQFIEAFKPTLNCRHLVPGDEYRIQTDGQWNLLNLTIQTDLVSIYHLRRSDENFCPSKEEVFLNKKTTRITGVIEGSLFGAITQSGEQDQLAIDLADIFAWDIDFRHDPQKGDQFALVVEKYFKDEQFFSYGKIQVAEYTNRGKVYRAIYFKDPKGQEGYFTPEGVSVRRSFLRAPLKFTRVSSGYSHSRLHPILKRRRPHLGIDFAAPLGTPVWAVGDGVVIERGWRGGNGNTVRIRHPLGYETMYNHLSRFGKTIRVGKRVTQKAIIGYVGSTGLSTGPHLDYRMKKHGRFINPLLEKFPPGLPVDKAYRALFAEVSRNRIAQLEGADLPPQKMVAAR